MTNREWAYRMCAAILVGLTIGGFVIWYFGPY